MTDHARNRIRVELLEDRSNPVAFADIAGSLTVRDLPFPSPTEVAVTPPSLFAFVGPVLSVPDALADGRTVTVSFADGTTAVGRLVDAGEDRTNILVARNLPRAGTVAGEIQLAKRDDPTDRIVLGFQLAIAVDEVSTASPQTVVQSTPTYASGTESPPSDAEPRPAAPIAQASFQAGELKGVAATLTAGGFGLTLTRARYALFVDKWWNDAVNDQARHRIHRIGQTEVQLVTELVADHDLDARVAQILRMKAGWSKPVADAEFGAGPVSQKATPAAALPAPETFEAPQARMAREREVVAQAAAQAAKEWCLRCGQQATLSDRGLCPACASGGRRPAKSALERWAENGLLALSGLDPDRAREVNGVGFNKLDGEFGHKLAGRLPALTDREWLAAVRMLREYYRQIGPPPGADGADFDPA